MNITTVGLDLAKNAFHVICVDVNGKEIKKRMLRRNQVRLRIPEPSGHRFRCKLGHPFRTKLGQAFRCKVGH